jgi:hypothetical protein
MPSNKKTYIHALRFQTHLHLHNVVSIPCSIISINLSTCCCHLHTGPATEVCDIVPVDVVAIIAGLAARNHPVTARVPNVEIQSQTIDPALLDRHGLHHAHRLREGERYRPAGCNLRPVCISDSTFWLCVRACVRACGSGLHHCAFELEQ